MDLNVIESAANNMAELLGDMIARDKNDCIQDDYDPNVKYSEPIAALSELIELVESARGEIRGLPIPMAPDEWPEDDDNLYYYYTCPCCEKTVFEGLKKCLCGQVLDWSGIR